MRVTTLAILLLAIVPCAVVAQDTTTTASDDTSYGEYHESPISLPMAFGVRIPTYDRVNGLTLPWGPELALGDEKLQVDALVSYRSNLGKWDPSISGVLRPGGDNEIKVFAGRGTFSNDTWIRSDIVNSLAAIGVGSDARNYFRGDRATARLTHTLQTAAITLTPFIGGNIERDWSTGSLAPRKSPWSFYGRKGVLRMRRPNPPVAPVHVNSILGGSGILVERGSVNGRLDVQVEHSLTGSRFVACPDPLLCLRLVGSKFTQFTLDSKVQFPTFGAQTFAFMGHAVVTGNAVAPPQRFAYLGGSGTLATVNLLALGGDRLLYVQGDYTIPIEQVKIRFLGSPFVALRYAAGNAGVGDLPPLIQNVGVGAGVSFIRVDYAIDPARNRSPFSRRSATTFGLSLPF
jgi:hypothetical protein